MTATLPFRECLEAAPETSIAPSYRKQASRSLPAASSQAASNTTRRAAGL